MEQLDSSDMQTNSTWRENGSLLSQHLVKMENANARDLWKWVRSVLKRFYSYVDEPLEKAQVGLLLLAIIIIVLEFDSSKYGKWETYLDSFNAGFGTELAGILITIFILDKLQARRAEATEKEALVLQMGSPDNAFAIEAVRQLSAKGWLVDGTLQKAMLGKADLNGANLSWADLSGAVLYDAKLIEADLYEANLSKAYLSEAKLIGANLIGAKLIGARLFKADLNGANLNDAKLSRAYLEEADLSGVDLSGANLIAANLKNAKCEKHLHEIGSRDTHQPNVFGSDLLAQRLDANAEWLRLQNEVEQSRTKFIGATYNSEIVWPHDDFDPVAAGAILVDDKGNPIPPMSTCEKKTNAIT